MLSDFGLLDIINERYYVSSVVMILILSGFVKGIIILKIYLAIIGKQNKHFEDLLEKLN